MNKAFTLVELIVVISIVALLSMLGLSTYSTVQEDARNSVRKSDLKEMQKALEIYKNERGEYPNTKNAGGNPQWYGMCNHPWGKGNLSDTGAGGFIPDLAPNYMQRLPADPRSSIANSSSASSGCQTNAEYNCYLYKSDGVDYKLLAHCTPESEMQTTDPFFDPCRPTWAWQVSSSSLRRGVLNGAGTGCVSGGTGW